MLGGRMLEAIFSTCDLDLELEEAPEIWTELLEVPASPFSDVFWPPPNKAKRAGGRPTGAELVGGGIGGVVEPPTPTSTFFESGWEFEDDLTREWDLVFVELLLGSLDDDEDDEVTFGFGSAWGSGR